MENKRRHNPRAIVSETREQRRALLGVEARERLVFTAPQQRCMWRKCVVQLCRGANERGANALLVDCTGERDANGVLDTKESGIRGVSRRNGEGHVTREGNEAPARLTCQADECVL